VVPVAYRTPSRIEVKVAIMTPKVPRESFWETFDKGLGFCTLGCVVKGMMMGFRRRYIYLYFSLWCVAGSAHNKRLTPKIEQRICKSW
jgi:hypothetical protein